MSNNKIGIIDETCYLAYEGQGYNPLTEEQQKQIANNSDSKDDDNEE